MEAKDIAVIIKACEKAGVSEFKMGEMEIKFKTSTDANPPNQVDYSNLIGNIQNSKNLIPVDSFENGSSQETNFNQDQDESEILHITDPWAWWEKNSNEKVEEELGDEL